MKRYLTIIIFSLNLCSFGQDCSMLKNGKYEAIYDDKNRQSSQFEVNGNKYSTFEDGIKKDYEIISLSNCSFWIKDDEKIDETKLTEFQKIISRQQPYFEITRTEENVYYFVCRENLHVQCGTGKFIKIDL